MKVAVLVGKGPLGTLPPTYLGSRSRFPDNNYHGTWAGAAAMSYLLANSKTNMVGDIIF